MKRREFLINGTLFMGGSLIPSINSFSLNTNSEKRYLFIVAAAGGASIVDSFLSSTEGPAAYSSNVINKPDNSPFSCVLPLNNSIGDGGLKLGNGYSQKTFLDKYKNEMAVFTLEGTSVTHSVAAKRSLTGDNINKGKTLGEQIALSYGGQYVLPNINMASGGYAVTGNDATLPDWAKAENISDPLMFAFSTHGFKGVKNTPSSETMELNRLLRSNLEKNSTFYKKNQHSKMVKNYLHNREIVMRSLEKGDVMTQFLIDLKNKKEYQKYNLSLSPQMNAIVNAFPNLADDPMEAQTALAFLLVKNGLTNVVTISPSQNLVLFDGKIAHTSPTAFDWSHTDHKGAQNSMWSYTLQNIDRLIELLKNQNIDNDPNKGSIWEKSIIYVATEFGRDKSQPNSGGSGHHLNNGSLLISPLIKGNSIYGSLDKKTSLTFGFDSKTGLPDKSVNMKEGDLYSLIAKAMNISFPNQKEFPYLIKKNT